MKTALHYLTTFPGILDAYFQYSIPGKSISKEIVSYQIHNIRDYTHDLHRTTDDSPFGGGPGMVMKMEPIVEALEKNDLMSSYSTVILPTPKGRPFTQEMAHYLSKQKQIVFLCGHYEGIDDRISSYIDLPISLGNFILGGGEIPSIVITDAVIRLIEGVLGNNLSSQEESFEKDQLLEHPNYTRPATFHEETVPDVLLSGHHKNIEEWKRTESLKWTLLLKPELLRKENLSKADLKKLRTIQTEMNSSVNRIFTK